MQPKLEKKGTLFSVNISDIRGKKKSCEICGKDFTMLIKEHQCKRCKRAVCFSCAQARAPVYRLKKFSEVAHRQCSKCKTESERMQKFIQQWKLVFGKDTVSAQWLQALNNKMSYPDITSEYYEYLNDPQFELKFKSGGIEQEQAYNEYKKTVQNMERIFSELQDTFNYSLQEFMYFAIDKTDQQNIIISISNVLKAFLCKNSDFGFSQELLLVIIFILCFASEPIAFMIICKFYEEIYPKTFYPLYIQKHGFQSQRHIKMILQLLQCVFQVSQGDAYHIQTFMDKDFMRISSQVSINTMTFENTFFMIDRTIKAGNFAEFLKVLSTICYEKLDEIKGSHNIEKLQVIILRNVEQETINQRLHEFDKVDIKIQQQVEELIQQDNDIGDKGMATRILESEQYQQVQHEVKHLQIINQEMRKKLQIADEENDHRFQEIQILQKKLDEANKHVKALEEQIFTQKLLLDDSHQKVVEAEDPHSEFVRKRFTLMEQQLTELTEKDKLRLEEIANIEKSRQELRNRLIKSEEANIALTKQAEQITFELQSLQYELDIAEGRNRGRGRESVIEEPKENPVVGQNRILQDKVIELEKKLYQMQEDQQEQKISQMRANRIQKEVEHELRTALIQVEVLQEQVKKEQASRALSNKQYEEKLQKVSSKSFSQLQVIHNSNETYAEENKEQKLKIEQLQTKITQDTQYIHMLEESNNTLKQEREELIKMSNLANLKDESDDFFAEFTHLQQYNDSQVARQVKAMFVKIRALQTELRFKNIDLLIKKEYLVSMQKKIRSLNTEVTHLKKSIAGEIPPPPPPEAEPQKQSKKLFSLKEHQEKIQNPAAAPKSEKEKDKDKDCSIF